MPFNRSLMPFQLFPFAMTMAHSKLYRGSSMIHQCTLNDIQWYIYSIWFLHVSIKDNTDQCDYLMGARLIAIGPNQHSGCNTCVLVLLPVCCCEICSVQIAMQMPTFDVKRIRADRSVRLLLYGSLRHGISVAKSTIGNYGRVFFPAGAGRLERLVCFHTFFEPFSYIN